MPILDLPDNRCLTGDRGLGQESDKEGRTKVHDVVAADCTVVDDDVYPCVKSTQRERGNDAHPKPIALQHSTRERSKRVKIRNDGASTFLTSNLFLSFPSSFVFLPDPAAGGSTSMSSAMIVEATRRRESVT